MPKQPSFGGMYGGDPSGYNQPYTDTDLYDNNPYSPNWNKAASNNMRDYDPSDNSLTDPLYDGSAPEPIDPGSVKNPESKARDTSWWNHENRNMVGQGLLYGANMFANIQNEYRQDRDYEKAMMKRFQQQPIYDYNAMYGDNQPIIKAEEGAQVRKPGAEGMPIEIEGGEFLILPDGTTELAKGPKHKNGGIPTVLPDKSIVYSNKLMPHGSKETFAKIAKKQDFSSELKTLKNPFASDVAKNSAQRMYDRKRKTLSEIFQMQQVMNGNSSGEPKGMSQENKGSEQPPMNPNEAQMMMGQPNDMMAFGGPYYEPYNVQYGMGGSYRDQAWRTMAEGGDIDNEEAEYGAEDESTEQITSWEENGKYYFAPTVVDMQGQQTQLSEKDAQAYAMKTGNYKEFDDAKKAQAFVNNGYQEADEYAYGGMINPYSQGGAVDNSVMKLVEFKNGGIYINPKNKGKFTLWAKSHGMSVQEAASHVMANKDKYSSTIVKRANFAKNASKFKHEMGGTIEYAEGGVYDLDDQEIERLRKLGYEIEIG